jgi:hypothetical protein
LCFTVATLDDACIDADLLVIYNIGGNRLSGASADKIVIRGTGPKNMPPQLLQSSQTPAAPLFWDSGSPWRR